MSDEQRTPMGIGGLRIKPMFAWYDLWIGVFVDRPKRRVYVFPLPCIGFVIERRIPTGDGIQG